MADTPQASPVAAATLQVDHAVAIAQGAVSGAVHGALSAERSGVRAEIAGHQFSTVLIALAVGVVVGGFFVEALHGFH